MPCPAGNDGVGRWNELYQDTGVSVRFAGPDKKTLYNKTSYIVGTGAVSKVQVLSQGFKGRAKEREAQTRKGGVRS